jgi:hypothetical protein
MPDTELERDLSLCWDFPSRGRAQQREFIKKGADSSPDLPTIRAVEIFSAFDF